MIPVALKRWLGMPHSCENPKSIFIGLIGGVGDLVSAAPSVVALKKKYPSAKISFGVGDGIFFLKQLQKEPLKPNHQHPRSIQ
jgi:hypothetical protein